ncbi:collagen alpha-1(I) chain-like [Ammospiza nelsoni]|uniref:collagen alpha-1(I) chain-like n=1 Tax=Ammospiza nelsoni TaxID=2857394 RepID=UPI00286A2A92|nr:collagen alpha-1(I) chain-like [Ammospiza nelsoni]
MAEGGAGAAGRPAPGGERGPPAGRPPARRGARSKARPPQPPQARPPAARGAAILAPGGPSAAIGRCARGVADPPIAGGRGRDVLRGGACSAGGAGDTMGDAGAAPTMEQDRMELSIPGNRCGKAFSSS